MMICECPYPMPDVNKRRFERLSMKMQPSQPQMVSMTKFRSLQPSRMKSRQKLIVAKVSAGEDQRHTLIMPISRFWK